MPVQTMTVAFVNAPKPGKTRGSIKGADGSLLGCFADKMHLFEIGQTYDVEYTEANSNGVTYRNVKTATLIVPPAHQETRSAPQPSRPVGVPATQAAPAPMAAPKPSYAVSEDINRQTHPIDAERMWCCSILNAAIQSGRINPNEQELFAMTMMLRRLWQNAFMTPGGAYNAGEPQHRYGRG